MRYDVCDMKRDYIKVIDPVSGDWKIENVRPCVHLDEFLREMDNLDEFSRQMDQK